MRVLIAVVLLLVVWVGVALYICNERQLPQPPAVYIDEPDAGPGMWPARADCSSRVSPEPLRPKPRHNYDYSRRGAGSIA